jgi:hypothetical protein
MKEKERCYSFILSRTPHEGGAWIKKSCETTLDHHHHQPIDVPTVGAQAFLMEYPQGEDCSR